MTLREVQAIGLEAVEIATQLLQRARLGDPIAGLWEAADIQWSWRTPLSSDNLEKTFWFDIDGPVAGIWMSCGQDDEWQIDPIVVPGLDTTLRETVWERAMQHIAIQSSGVFEIPVGDDDELYTRLAGEYGLTRNSRDSTGWLDAKHRPVLAPVAEGFTIVDRARMMDTPHHMRTRGGDDIEHRLKQCSLYDPSLDLAVVTESVEVAGYSLYWFDRVTGVGLVEPVRVEDNFQRKGLARVMVTAGISRLADLGAKRIKVSYGSEAAGALYTSVGFVTTGTTTWYQSRKR